MIDQFVIAGQLTDMQRRDLLTVLSNARQRASNDARMVQVPKQGVPEGGGGVWVKQSDVDTDYAKAQTQVVSAIDAMVTILQSAKKPIKKKETP